MRILILFISLQLMNFSCDDEIKKREPTKNVFPGEKLNLIWKSERNLAKIESISGLYRTLYSIIDNCIIVGRDDLIEMLNKNTGVLKWRCKLNNYSQLESNRFYTMDEFIIESNLLYYIERQFVYCINIETGEKVWTSKDFGSTLNCPLRYSKQCHSEKAIFISDRATGTPNQKVYAISKVDGSIMWETESPLINTPGFEYSGRIEAPAYSSVSNCVYVGSNLGCCDGSIIAIDAETGKKKWETRFKVPVDSTSGCKVNFPDCSAPFTPITIDDGIIIRSGTYCTKLDFEGNIKWQTLIHHNCDYGNSPVAGLVYNNNYYTYSQGGPFSFVCKIDAKTGQFVWSNYLTNGNSSYYNTILVFSSKVFDDKLYKLSDAGWLFGTNLETGQHEVMVHLPVQVYTDPETGEKIQSGCAGGFAVEGNRIYYLGTDYLFCAEIDTTQKETIGE